MLGKRVEVEIYGLVSKNYVYTGYITEKEFTNAIVYVVSHRPVKDIVRAIVIAEISATAEQKHKIIAAPQYDSLFYAPELKDILSGIRNLNTDKLHCYYEKSCGGIVFNFLCGKPKILLVKNRNGRYWSFPKGHMEKGENEIQTARREIFEETGLEVEFIDGFREVSDYSPFGRTRKKVIFFLAEAYTDNVNIQTEEIDYFTWVDIKDAKQMCCYENDIRIISKAEKVLCEIREK